MMKKVDLSICDDEIIMLGDVPDSKPIFAKKDGKLVGMLIREEGEKKYGQWILRTGGSFGATGHYSTRIQCLGSCLHLGFEFFTE